MDLPSGPRELNRQRWFAHVENWQRSGLTQKVFCEQQQLGLASFQRWRGIVAREKPSASASPPAFLPVHIAAPSASSLTLLLGDELRLEIPAGFDAATLQQVIHILQSP